MKKTTKLLPIIIIVAVLLASLCLFGVMATDETVSTITAESVTVQKGTTVELDISIKNNPGILAMTLRVSFDSDILILKSVEKGDALEYATFTTPKELSDGCNLPWDAEFVPDTYTKDGVIAKLTFEISDTAKGGDSANITLSYDAGAIIDDDLAPIDIKLENGVIDIIDYLPGDANGDGIINTTDVAFIRRHIAGGYGVTVNMAAADVNADGIVNTTDVAFIRRYVAGGYGVTLKPSPLGAVHKHSEVIIHAIPATCTESGLTEGKKCSVCELIIVEQTATPIIDHIAGTNQRCTMCNCSIGLIFTSNGDGTCYVSGIGTCTDTDIVIPSVYNGESVTEIGSKAFYSCSKLTSIAISDSVTNIGSSAFAYCSSLKSISIPNSVTHIRGNAFLWCSNLMDITFGNNSNLTSIGDYIFQKCVALKSITIPKSVTSIGTNPFIYCSGLESINVADGNSVYHSAGNCLIETKSKTLLGGCKTSVIPSDGSVTRIGHVAFCDCEGLISITLPASVTSIGNDAFCNCSSLESITVADGNSVYHSAGNCLIETESKILIVGCKNSIIPNDGSVTSIGYRAFWDCSSLESITIPDSVTSIGNDAFNGCEGLTSITIPDSVTSIGEAAFMGCESLIYNEKDGVKYLGNSTNPYVVAILADTSITSVELPSTVKVIYPHAFNCCFELITVTFDENSKLTSIAEYAFFNCSSLTSIIIPNNVTSIGEAAFYYCSSLTSITMPNSVVSIGSSALAWCKSLTDIYFTGTEAEWNKITKGEGWDSNIGDYTIHFVEPVSEVLIFTSNGDGTCYVSGIVTCTDTDIVIPSIYNGESVTGIGDSAFYNRSNLTSITIPDSVTSIGNSAFFNCSSLTSINIPDSVTSIGVGTFDGTQVIEIEQGVSYVGKWVVDFNNTVTSVNIKDGTFGIATNAFLYCDRLTSITIPDSVTSIGKNAFSDCDSLTSITFGDDSQLTYIGSGAFYNCGNLTSITIPNSVTSIGIYAFFDCDRLTSITIPEGVTSIGNYAFQYCLDLTSVTIPDSVSSIGKSAFFNCSSLNDIYFRGTEEEWNAITKDSSWDSNTGDYTIHYNYVEL